MELHKTVQGVETAEEQCEALNSIPDHLAVEILNGTFNTEERLKLPKSFLSVEGPIKNGILYLSYSNLRLKTSRKV